MKNIKNTIKQTKVDAIYGKKKHFNASSRKKKYHHQIGIAIVVISVFEGSALCKMLSTKNEDFIIVLSILSFILAFLGAIQTFFKFNADALGHEKVANQYLSLSKKCKKIIGFIEDNLIDKNQVVNYVNEIEAEINMINNLASKYSTNKKDYKYSRQGVKDGEETYLEEELNI